MKKVKFTSLILGSAFLVLATFFSACSVTKKSKSNNKTEVSTETKTEIKYETKTEFVDTGSIRTIREIEFRTIYDTIQKKLIVVKWRERETKAEKKAYKEETTRSGIITQETRKDSTQVSKQAESVKKGGNAWKFYSFLLLLILVSLFLYLNFKKYF